MFTGFAALQAGRADQRRASRRRAFDGLMEGLEARRLLSALPDATPFLQAQPFLSQYSPSQIGTAYGFNHIMLPAGTLAGAGQTIAIIDAYGDPYIASDLATFDATYGVAAPPSLTVVSQTGSTTALPGGTSWSGEISLDVEWAHAMAPGANILLVEANSSGYFDLLTGVSYAASVPGVSVISMSWGGADFSFEYAIDSYFSTPSGHTPITFVAATGDNGSYAGPDWPADSPNVLGVGGTSLSTSGTGQYYGESGWSGSTGGISSVESEPSYQRSVQSTGYRTEPDVSYDADPYSGYPVYATTWGGWFVCGGTSAAAPQWSSLIAIADQVRVAEGKTTLDGPTVTLPTLYSAYSNPTAYAADFHDVTSGWNGNYSAGVGYDEVTGLGTPKASAIVQLLAGGVRPASAAAIRVRAASGSVGLHKLPHTLLSPLVSESVGIGASVPVSVKLQVTEQATPDFTTAVSTAITDAAALDSAALVFTDTPVLQPLGAIALTDYSLLQAFPTVAPGEVPAPLPQQTSPVAHLGADRHPFSDLVTLHPSTSLSSAAMVLAEPDNSHWIAKAAAALGITVLMMTIVGSQSKSKGTDGQAADSLAEIGRPARQARPENPMASR